MSKEKHNNENAHTPESETPEVMDVLDTQETGNIETGEAMAEEESLQEQLDAALEQVEKDKQDYLMLMADFDNYRKRMMREKADLLKKRRRTCPHRPSACTRRFRTRTCGMLRQRSRRSHL